MTTHTMNFDDPSNVREVLLTAEWGYQTQNGVITAIFCPMCSAMVPPGGPDDGKTNKVHHIQYHVDIAYYLQKITNGGHAE